MSDPSGSPIHLPPRGSGFIFPVPSEVDPGALGARATWYVPSTGALSVRDDANAAWVLLSPVASAPTLAVVLTAGNAAGGKKITGVTDPTAAQDAATKAYVDLHAGLPIVTYAACSADITVSAANAATAVTGATISLAAGTYVISGQVTVDKGTTYVYGDLFDNTGAAIIAAAQLTEQTLNTVVLAGRKITLAVPTVVNLRFTSDDPAAKAKQLVNTAPASYLSALLVA